ncbi:hypothetical protein Cni_G26965 [Canna indica]|uniref:Uncharacterized protein n=1 Tax=Canna indica TaxID=4628 RepID=A0AAQ3L321_9LILI|nr:hypothetical protein Cni_G26965 [Canna indica]
MTHPVTIAMPPSSARHVLAKLTRAVRCHKRLCFGEGADHGGADVVAKARFLAWRNLLKTQALCNPIALILYPYEEFQAAC